MSVGLLVQQDLLCYLRATENKKEFLGSLAEAAAEAGSFPCPCRKDRVLLLCQQDRSTGAERLKKDLHTDVRVLVPDRTLLQFP